MKMTIAVLTVLTFLTVLLVASGCDMDLLKMSKEKYPDAIYKPIDDDGDGIVDTVLIDKEADGTWDGEVPEAANALKAAGDVDQAVADGFQFTGELLGLSLITNIGLFLGRRKVLKTLIASRQAFKDVTYTVQKGRDALGEYEDMKEVLDDQLIKQLPETSVAVDEVKRNLA